MKRFSDLKTLLAKATPARSGDEPHLEFSQQGIIRIMFHAGHGQGKCSAQ